MLKLVATAGVILTALLASGFVFLRGSASPNVFNGVSLQDMSQRGVTLLEESPADAPRVSRDEATNSLLGQLGLTVEASELVGIDVAASDGVPPRPSGRFTAWAARLDTSHVANEDHFGPGLGLSNSASRTIVFLDADSGDYLREYFVPATPSPVRTLAIKSCESPFGDANDHTLADNPDRAFANIELKSRPNHVTDKIRRIRPKPRTAVLPKRTPISIY